MGVKGDKIVFRFISNMDIIESLAENFNKKNKSSNMDMQPSLIDKAVASI